MLRAHNLLQGSSRDFSHYCCHLRTFLLLSGESRPEHTADHSRRRRSAFLLSERRVGMPTTLTLGLNLDIAVEKGLSLALDLPSTSLAVLAYALDSSSFSRK